MLNMRSEQTAQSGTSSVLCILSDEPKLANPQTCQKTSF